MKLNAPYLILIGEEEDSTYAKTGQGIVQWRPELVAGQLRFPGCQVDMGVPDMTVDEAVSQGVRSLIIGVAPVRLGTGLEARFVARSSYSEVLCVHVRLCAVRCPV